MCCNVRSTPCLTVFANTNNNIPLLAGRPRHVSFTASTWAWVKRNLQYIKKNSHSDSERLSTKRGLKRMFASNTVTTHFFGYVGMAKNGDRPFVISAVVADAMLEVILDGNGSS